MNECKSRFDKSLADIRKLLNIEKAEIPEVKDFFSWLCSDFPAHKKSYEEAHNKKSFRELMQEAAKHAEGLARVLADPLMRGTLHIEAIKDAQARGERAPSFSDLHAWEDAVITLNNLLNSASTARLERSGGDNKKLGILPPKRWIVVLCADVFQRYRKEEAAAGNSDFLNFVVIAWYVVTGDDDAMTQAVKDAMPEVKAWTAAMMEVRGSAS